MALNLITNPPTVPTISPDHWTQFVTRSNANMKGVDFSTSTFCLTNWNTGTSKPEICQGSIFEVGGSFYEADSDTALVDDGGLIDGQVHIKLVPNVGGTQVIPTLTSDAIPAWDGTKYGWYDGDEKFLPVEMTRSGAITKVFSAKFEYISQNKINKLFADGGQYIGGNTEVNGALSVSGGVAMNGALSGVTSGSPVFTSVQSGGGSAIKWKTFYGTLNSGGDADISHGLTSTNIVGASSTVRTSTLLYYFGSYSSSSGGYVILTHDSTLIRIRTSDLTGSTFASQPYKVVVFYI